MVGALRLPEAYREGLAACYWPGRAEVRLFRTRGCPLACHRRPGHGASPLRRVHQWVHAAPVTLVRHVLLELPILTHQDWMGAPRKLGLSARTGGRAGRRQRGGGGGRRAEPGRSRAAGALAPVASTWTARTPRRAWPPAPPGSRTWPARRRRRLPGLPRGRRADGGAAAAAQPPPALETQRLLLFNCMQVRSCARARHCACTVLPQ